MTDPFRVVRDFEAAVAEYCGAPLCVAVNSCTNALLIALDWFMRLLPRDGSLGVSIPRYTYLSVPMSIVHAGAHPMARDEWWIGQYRLDPFPLWDSARAFTSGMYLPGQMMCTSHHWTKTLGVQQGGCILLEDPEAYEWLKRQRFDGRTEGVAPRDDRITQVGRHCYMSPEVAALGLVRMATMPKHNPPLPHDLYPDWSTMAVFQEMR